MISEKDIFDSVFFPDLVEPSKKEIIENSPGYKYLLDFYTKIKSELNTPVSSEVKQKLANKISIYRNTQIFRLRSVNENKPRKKRDYTILAAASEAEKPEIVAKSFFDENNRFLIRVVKSQSITRIYTFSTDGEVIQNFKLKILPSGKEFLMKNNSAPLEIKEALEFEEVQLELV